jgi:hypothetical protein
MRRLAFLAPLVVHALGCSDKTYGTRKDLAPTQSTLDGGPPAPMDAGTTSDAADTSSGVEGNGNNTGIVDTDIVPPQGTNAISRKLIVTDFNDPTSELTVGPSYMASASFTGSSSRSIVQVQNNGARTRCFVAATSFRLLDVENRVLATESQEYVTGSIRAGINSPGCLGPGEIGYFLGYHSVSFDAVDRVSLTIDPGEIRTGVPGARMVTEKVETITDAISSSVRVTFRNVGTTTAKLDSFSGKVLFFNGIPVGWESLGWCSGSSALTVKPGEGAVLCTTTPFNGRATRAQAWCGFHDE